MSVGNVVYICFQWNFFLFFLVYILLNVCLIKKKHDCVKNKLIKHLSENRKFVYLNKMMNIDYIKKKVMVFTYHILSKGLNGAALNLYSNRHDCNKKRQLSFHDRTYATA